MFNKTALIFVCMLFWVASHAVCDANSCYNEKVDVLYPTRTGVIYVGTTGDETKLDCAAEAGVYALLDLSSPGADAIYSTLLTAYSLDKDIQVRIVNGSQGCLIQYVNLKRQ